MIDFIQDVPRDLDENLEYRIHLLEEARKSVEIQNRLWWMCKQDILYYVNAFCWAYNPRDYPDNPHRPFITWGYQDDLFLKGVEAVRTKRDFAIPKSRQLGVTWVVTTLCDWFWKFFEAQNIFLCSRTEEYVDERGTPKELFWKIDYQHKRQPRWLNPPGRHLGRADENRPKNAMKNHINGSIVAGGATVPDLGRGDVYTMMVLDEAASMEKADEISRSTRNATHTRIWPSTPKGRVGKGKEFYRQAHNKANIIRKVHWSEHPEKSKLMYRFLNASMTAENPSDQAEVSKYELESKDLIAELRRRGYTLEGKLRSPYYDLQCARSSSESEISQEEDIDFLSEGTRYFNDEVLSKYIDKHTALPMRRGILDIEQEGEKFEWIEHDQGPWRLWVDLDYNHKPIFAENSPKYLVGVDIAAGLGGTHSSNSCIQVLELHTCRQVAVFVSNSVKPDVLARLAVATCDWFSDTSDRGASLNWEINGAPGSEFSRKIIDIGYGNVYYRENRSVFAKKKTKKPGWMSTKETKSQMLGELRSAITHNDILIKEKETLEECGEYVVEGDKIVHAGSTNADDQAARGEAHGDRVIALGMALILRKEQEVNEKIKKEEKPEYPYGSMGWRMAQHDERMALAAAGEGCEW